MSSLKHIYIYFALIVLTVMGGLVASCSSDEVGRDDQRPLHKLHLMTAQQHYGDLDIATTRSTFEVSSGDDKATYETYEVPGSSLRVYITTKDRLDFYGDFLYTKEESSDNYSWTKEVPIDNDNYYIYGFMAASLKDKASIGPNGSGYDKGAVLTINNVPSLMTEDFAVIVGLKRTNSKTGTIGTDAASTPALGDYSYNAEGSDNYVYILLDHLYSRLRFKMNMSEEYSQVRKIYLKKMELTPALVSKFNVTATLTAGRFYTLDADYIPFAGTGNKETLFLCEDDLYTDDGDGDKPGICLGTSFINFITTDTPAAFATNRSQYVHDVYIAPANIKLSLECTYDIYDSKGNLIRENQTATNTFSLGTLNAGTSYTVNLTVAPTYLYVLSEPDLDNPTIKVGS